MGFHQDAPECAACIMLTGLAQPLLVAFSNALLLVAKSKCTHKLCEVQSRLHCQCVPFFLHTMCVSCCKLSCLAVSWRP